MPSWAAITTEDFQADGWLNNDPKLADIHPALRRPEMIQGPQSILQTRYSSGQSDYSDESSNKSHHYSDVSIPTTELESIAKLYEMNLNLDGGSDKIAVVFDDKKQKQTPPIPARKSSANGHARRKRSNGSIKQRSIATPQDAGPQSPKYSLFPMPPRTPPKGEKSFHDAPNKRPPPIPQTIVQIPGHYAPPSVYTTPTEQSPLNGSLLSVPKRNGSATNVHQSRHQPSASTSRLQSQSESQLTPIASVRSSMALPADEPVNINTNKELPVPGVAASPPSLVSAPTPSITQTDQQPLSSLQLSDLATLSHWSSDSHGPSSCSVPSNPRSSSSLSSRQNSHRKTLTSITASSKLKLMLKATSPLIEAAKTNNLPMLLHHLAPGPSNTLPATLSPTDRDGLTPLHWAAQLGHSEIVLALLSRNVHTEKHTKQQDRTPLYLASQHNQPECTRLLLSAGAAVNATSKMDGATALHKAAQQGHEDILRLLLAAGANANKRDIEGMTPLMWAFQGKQLHAAHLLVLAGANLEEHIRRCASSDDNTSKGLTVLHKAVQSSNSLFARLFLEGGANPNSSSTFSLTPLHRASGKGDFTMVQLLLEFGADVDRRNDAGWTPLHSAARYGHRRVCGLLVGNGAAWNALTNDGDTAEALARRNGFVDVL